MIGFGSSNTKSYSFGNSQVKSIYFGPSLVYQLGYYVIPEYTSLQIESAQTSGSMTVDSNTAWTASVSGGSWLTITASTTGVSYNATKNTSEVATGRNAYIEYKINNVVCASTLVNQKAAHYNYVFQLYTANPMPIGSADTFFYIVVNSSKDNSPLQPSCTIGSNTMGVSYSGMTSTGNTFMFGFTCDRNSATSQKSVEITFTQPQSQNSIVAVVNQGAKYVVTPPSGFTTGATSNGWYIGTYKVNSTDNALAIMRKDPVGGTKYATYDAMCVYATGGTYYPNTASTFSGTSIAIRTTDVIQIPDGDSGYGITITTQPYLAIAQVNNFSVST